MKRFLENLRSKPPEIRLLTATLLAAGATALIVLGWLMVPSKNASAPQNNNDTAPGPLNALLDSVTGIVRGDKKSDDKKIEIINAGQSDQSYEYDMYDETNPNPEQIPQ